MFLAFNKSSKGNNPTVALLHIENRCLAHKTNNVTQKETIISKPINSDLRCSCLHVSMADEIFIDWNSHKRTLCFHCLCRASPNPHIKQFHLDYAEDRWRASSQRFDCAQQICRLDPCWNENLGDSQPVFAVCSWGWWILPTQGFWERGWQELARANLPWDSSQVDFQGKPFHFSWWLWLLLWQAPSSIQRVCFYAQRVEVWQRRVCGLGDWSGLSHQPSKIPTQRKSGLVLAIASTSGDVSKVVCVLLSALVLAAIQMFGFA